MSRKVPIHSPFQAQSLDELYVLLQGEQYLAQISLGWRGVGLLTCMAASVLLPGVVGNAALCLAGLALVACVSAATDFVARHWFMHAVTLQHLLGPRYDNADLQMAIWATEELKGSADGQA